ncbi:DUF5983 family protein [Marinobacter sp. MBR-105]|jgi:hypothetical protein
MNKITTPGTLNELIQTDDQYKAIGVSTAHIMQEDAERLSALAETGHSLIAARPSGAFVKLHADDPKISEPRPLEHTYQGFSDAFYSVLRMAKAAGYRLIEFDEDATIYDGIVTFDW